MVNRKLVYLKWIENSLTYLKSFQDMSNSETKGCFFYPYHKKEIKYCNARWQEAVLTCAWYYNKTRKKEYKIMAEAGIDFWSKIQHKRGFFSQYSKHDQSFAATAFSSLAVLLALDYIDVKKEWKDSLDGAARWLVKNDDTVLVNQEAVAAAALLLYANKFDKSFIKASESKLMKVLENQKDGYYLENFGNDFSYSTLTLEMLGIYYLNCKNEILRKRILDSAKSFIKMANGNKYEHIRNTNWMILDGFEIFFNDLNEIKNLLPNLMKSLDVYHMNDHRHVCTDSYRFCLAYDHANKFLNEDFGISKIRVSTPKPFSERSSIKHRFINILRIFGVHRFKKIRRLLRW